MGCQQLCCYWQVPINTVASRQGSVNSFSDHSTLLCDKMGKTQPCVTSHLESPSDFASNELSCSLFSHWWGHLRLQALKPCMPKGTECLVQNQSLRSNRNKADEIHFSLCINLNLHMNWCEQEHIPHKGSLRRAGLLKNITLLLGEGGCYLGKYYRWRSESTKQSVAKGKGRYITSPTL